MSTCPKCGAKAAEGATSCEACGASLGSSAPAAPEKSVGEPAAATPGGVTVPGSPVAAAMQVGGVVEAAGAVAFSAAARAAQRKTHLPKDTLIDQKYSIERVLGEGGMGVVYLAHDIHTRTPVVLKAVRSDLIHRKDVRDRTLAEGRAIAQIDHPNVVHLNAIVVEGQSLWLVMQYIDGESLDRMIERYIAEKRPMPVDEALRIFRQIVAGVSAIHREGMIHRDLKPANVLIRKKDGVAKVTDFGIAKIEEDARAGKGMTKGIIGSLWYMSPEQVTGQRDLDKRVDVYALGIVIYEMLVGRVPFDAESDHEIMRLHIKAPVPRVSQMRRDVPEAVDAIIQKACAKDRADRFSDGGEILRALDALGAQGSEVGAGGAGVEDRPTVPATLVRLDAGAKKTEADAAPRATTTQDVEPEKPPAPRRKRSWVIAGVALVALLAGAGALFALGLIPGIGPRRAGQSARGDAVPTAPVASSQTTPAPPSSTPGERPTGSSPPASTSPPSASPSSPAPPAKSPLEALVGPWVGNERDLDAVLSGNELEFRVRDPAQFETQGYQQGEARFALLAVPGETRVFAVEDRVRPIPPSGKTYDAKRSRSTCREIWTSAGGQPLRATFDGARLTVEFVKIEPKDANFILDKGAITSCIGLRKLSTAKVVSTLDRPPP